MGLVPPLGPGPRLAPPPKGDHNGLHQRAGVAPGNNIRARAM